MSPFDHTASRVRTVPVSTSFAAPACTAFGGSDSGEIGRSVKA
jgi:hypothetical protein